MDPKYQHLSDEEFIRHVENTLTDPVGREALLRLERHTLKEYTRSHVPVRVAGQGQYGGDPNRAQENLINMQWKDIEND